MREIKLKKGYLVCSWSGEVEEVEYFETKYNYLGSIDEKFIMFKNNIMLEPITKYNPDKLFDNENEAYKHSKVEKTKRIEYYEKQIKEYQENIKELKQKL